jgi:hypothetical protein
VGGWNYAYPKIMVTRISGRNDLVSSSVSRRIFLDASGSNAYNSCRSSASGSVTESYFRGKVT